MTQMHLHLQPELDEAKIDDCVHHLRAGGYSVKQKRRNLVSGPKMYLIVIVTDKEGWINTNLVHTIVGEYFHCLITSVGYNTATIALGNPK